MQQPSNRKYYIEMAKTAVLASLTIWFGFVALATLMGY